MKTKYSNAYSAWFLFVILAASLITLWLNRDVFYFSTRVEATVKPQNSTTVLISYGAPKHQLTATVPAQYTASQQRHSISIENLFQKDPKGMSDEVWVFQVLVDGTPVSWSHFKYRGGWVKRPDGRATEGYAMMSYQPGTRTTMQLTGISGSRVDIEFLSHPWSGRAEVNVDGRNQILDLYSPDQKMFDYPRITGTPTYSTYTFYLEPTKLFSLNFSGDNSDSVINVKDVRIAWDWHNTEVAASGTNNYDITPGISRSPYYNIFVLAGGIGVVCILVSLVIGIRQVYYMYRKKSPEPEDESSTGLSVRLVSILCTFSLALLLILFIAFYVSRLIQAPLMADDYSNMDNFQHFSSVAYNLFRLPMYARGFLWILILDGLLKTHVWLAHLMNVTVHLINCSMLVYIFRKVAKQKVGRRLSPLLFLLLAVNPFAVESLLWVTGGYPVYVLFFSLAASVCLMKYIRSHRLVYFILFVILSACAYFINEQGLLTVPFYIYITVATRSGEFTSRALISSIKSVAIVLLSWFIPYLVYRVILLVQFRNATAVQTYTEHFGVKLIISVYSEMMIWLAKTSILMELLTAISIFLLIIMVGVRKITRNRPVETLIEWRKYEVVFWSALFIVVLLIPFSLLAGWLEHRFFYISSCYALMFMFVLLSQSVGDLFELRSRNIWQSNIAKASAVCILLVSNVIGIWSAENYARDVLQPVSNLNFYVNSFIHVQNSAYRKLGNGSVVFMDVLDPSYPVPKYFNASSSIRVSWVPPSLRDLNIVNSNVNVLLLNGVTSLNGFEGVTPYTPWFIPFSTLKHLSATDKYRFYLGVYDGVTLQSPEYQRLKFTNINGAETMGFPLSPLNIN